MKAVLTAVPACMLTERRISEPRVHGASLQRYGMKANALTCLLLALATTYASAAQIEGEVVGVADGDTVVVLDAAKTQHKVRLSGIDAPERSQPFGSRSRQHLAGLVFRKQVVVEWSKHDRYGRVVGKLLLDGRDVCLAQVRAGMAWHYKAYQREQSTADQAAYAAFEDSARREGVGLWVDPRPVPPWEYRQLRREH